MNKKLRISLVVLITVALLVALVVPGMAAKIDKSFKLSFYFAEGTINWEEFTADGGAFVAYGAIPDEGTVSMHWNPIWGVFRGTMIFESSIDGDRFVVYFRAGAMDEVGCATGNFGFYPNLGTGDYFGMSGSGKMFICRSENGTGDAAYGTFTGIVNYP